MRASALRGSSYSRRSCVLSAEYSLTNRRRSCSLWRVSRRDSVCAAPLMAVDSPVYGGRAGLRRLLGLGNGAVFKLVPQFFPNNTATVTGLVGAMGGFGRIFPSASSRVFARSRWVVWPGFVLLALTSAILWTLNHIFIPRQKGRTGARTPGIGGCGRTTARRRLG